MPGSLIQQGATVLCAHGGQAIAAAPNPRVTASGGATAVITSPWMVAGCPGVPPAVPPCVTAQWLTGTTRVLSGGQPLVITAGEDDVGTLGPGAPGGLEPDARAAADQDDGLPCQCRFALGGARGGHDRLAICAAIGMAGRGMSAITMRSSFNAVS